MHFALYHPVYGYYGPGPRRIGRTGDFYTAVSVGPLYGSLLAGLAREVWEELGRPEDFTVIEQAAHDGQLAEDICAACEFSYLIVEPNPRYEEVQRQRLAGLGGRVNWAASLAELPCVPALYLCNELPDAMPVHLIRWDGSVWEECYVAVDADADGSRLRFVTGPLSSPELAAEAATLPNYLPAGYTTEISLAALAWMRELAGAAFQGAVCIADYGLDAVEFYSPERTTGTLRRYHGHQTDDRVLEDLGACDLTTHVNFTRLIEEAQAHGLKLRSYELQGRFLGRLGMEWLRSLDGGPPDAATRALLRQYQSLTHPAFMGRSFRMVVLEK